MTACIGKEVTIPARRKRRIGNSPRYNELEQTGQVDDVHMAEPRRARGDVFDSTCFQGLPNEHGDLVRHAVEMAGALAPHGRRHDDVRPDAEGLARLDDGKVCSPLGVGLARIDAGLVRVDVLVLVGEGPPLPAQAGHVADGKIGGPRQLYVD